MELRHLRYFVAVAEEGSFIRAAMRLHVAQPALSKQIRDLETELKTVLLQRGPRGVRLTESGRAFLTEARRTLEAASGAVASVRDAGASDTPLRFAHGQVAGYGTALEQLLSAFHGANAQTPVQISSLHDGEIFHELRVKRVDVGAVFIAEWPVAGFAAHRLIDAVATGVLLPSAHPLATRCTVELPELRSMTWLHSGPHRWPGFFTALESALRARGLDPERRLERARDTSAMNLQIATGDAWSLASEAIAAPYRTSRNGIVYRPFRETPIPCWLALVWLPPASPPIERLVEAARDIGLALSEHHASHV
jgi:LysR family transcriptional regulator, hca operon transcriptional activator